MKKLAIALTIFAAILMLTLFVSLFLELVANNFFGKTDAIPK